MHDEVLRRVLEYVRLCQAEHQLEGSQPVAMACRREEVHVLVLQLDQTFETFVSHFDQMLLDHLFTFIENVVNDPVLLLPLSRFECTCDSHTRPIREGFQLLFDLLADDRLRSIDNYFDKAKVVSLQKRIGEQQERESLSLTWCGKMHLNTFLAAKRFRCNVTLQRICLKEWVTSS